MKKVRLVIRIITIILVLLTIVSVILIVLSPATAFEATSEIISFIVGVSALIITIIAQIDNAREEARLHRIISELHELSRDNDDELKLNNKLERQVSEILARSRRIEDRLSRKRTNRKK